jgi:hypothetical protein
MPTEMPSAKLTPNPRPMEVDALGAIVAAEPQRHYSADTQQKNAKKTSATGCFWHQFQIVVVPTAQLSIVPHNEPQLHFA